MYPPNLLGHESEKAILVGFWRVRPFREIHSRALSIKTSEERRDKIPDSEINAGIDEVKVVFGLWFEVRVVLGLWFCRDGKYAMVDHIFNRMSPSMCSILPYGKLTFTVFLWNYLSLRPPVGTLYSDNVTVWKVLKTQINSLSTVALFCQFMLEVPRFWTSETCFWLSSLWERREV